MNDANYAVLNYLTDVYSIKDISQEGVESAIDLIFNIIFGIINEINYYDTSRKRTKNY